MVNNKWWVISYLKVTTFNQDLTSYKLPATDVYSLEEKGVNVTSNIEH